MSIMPPFSIRMQRAMELASHIHSDQIRKDPDLPIPYVSHLCAVSSLVLSHGCSEDVFIGALFHDVKEDRPGMMFLVEQFGEVVVRIVDEVSERKLDSFGRKRPWQERKIDHAEFLRSAMVESKMVVCADNVCNMRSLLMSCERGPQIWTALNSSPEENVFRWQHLLKCLREGWCEFEPHPLVREYSDALESVREIVHL